MSLFDWLLIGHLVGDFLLQTDGMARHKVQSWSWLSRHVAIYMAVITLVLALYMLSHPLPLGWILASLLFVAVTHVILDRRDFTSWWMRMIGISSEPAWLSIVVDQVFHLLSLALVAQALVLVSG